MDTLCVEILEMSSSATNQSQVTLGYQQSCEVGLGVSIWVRRRLGWPTSKGLSSDGVGLQLTRGWAENIQWSIFK